MQDYSKLETELDHVTLLEQASNNTTQKMAVMLLQCFCQDTCPVSELRNSCDIIFRMKFKYFPTYRVTMPIWHEDVLQSCK